MKKSLFVKRALSFAICLALVVLSGLTLCACGSTTDVITLADGNVSLSNDANAVTFANGNAVTISKSDTTFTITGTGATMSEAQAEAFWSGVAKEGDVYVILSFNIGDDDTLTYVATDGTTKTYTGETDVIVRVTGVDGSGNAIDLSNGQTYTVTTAENETAYKVCYNLSNM